MNEMTVFNQAPAIYTDHAMPGGSQKYSFVPTTDVIKVMEEQGWLPTAAQQTKTKNPDQQAYSKHLIKFARPDFKLADGDIPQVIAVNSHDRKTSLQFYFGIYRMVCCNGLIIAKAEVGRVRMVHSGINTGEVSSMLTGFVTQLDKVIGKIDIAKATIMSPSKALEFADRAYQLRWQDTSPQDTSVLLTPRRQVDRADDLWTTYNVIQENIINGGFDCGYKRQPRRIRGLNRTLDINTKLWNLAESYM